MAVSRRLRFEILKRDGYACRYCGAKAPDVPLTIDHVIPTTLGGGDEPNNLVTACADCNSGKASVSPDAQVVEDVDAAALLWAKAIERANGVRRAELVRVDKLLGQINDFWQSVEGEPYALGRPYNWADSIEVFLENGLTVGELLRYSEVALLSKASARATWRYFCGCCWREIGRRQELARTLIEDGEV